MFSHRWMEVIRSATCSSSHIRSMSRKEPHAYWPKRPSDRLPKHQHTHTHTGRLRQVLNQVLLTHLNIFLTAAGLSRNYFMCYIVISLYRRKIWFSMGSDVKFFQNIKVRVQRTTTVSSQHLTMDRSAGKSQTLPVLPFVVQKDTIS